MSARRLIVNADDFGLTPGVSAGILLAHRRGIVTSTTVLVTGALDRELLRAALDSALGLGLHVNLTHGTPLTGPSSLTDAAGRFVRDPRQAAARARPRDVEAEVAAQVERFVRLTGRTPTHLDSHHHVALWDPVAEVVLAVARRLGVPVRAETALARARARSRGVRTPDRFVGGSGPEPFWTPPRLRVELRRLPPGVTEFMTHPGHLDAALAASRYARQRETELVALGTPEARGAALALGVQLSHFGQLL